MSFRLEDFDDEFDKFLSEQGLTEDELSVEEHAEQIAAWRKTWESTASPGATPPLSLAQPVKPMGVTDEQRKRFLDADRRVQQIDSEIYTAQSTLNPMSNGNSELALTRLAELQEQSAFALTELSNAGAVVTRGEHGNLFPDASNEQLVVDIDTKQDEMEELDAKLAEVPPNRPRLRANVERQRDAAREQAVLIQNELNARATLQDRKNVAARAADIAVRQKALLPKIGEAQKQLGYAQFEAEGNPDIRAQLDVQDAQKALDALVEEFRAIPATAPIPGVNAPNAR